MKLHSTFQLVALLPFLLGAGQIQIDGSSGNLETGSLNKQLVLYVPLTSSTLSASTTPSELTPSNHTWTPAGTPVFSSDSVELDGSTEYFEHSESNWRGSDTAGSLIVWFKETGQTATKALFSTSDEATATNNFFLTTTGTGAARAMRLTANTAGTFSQIKTDTAITDNEWNCGAVTSNGSRYLMYMNGPSTFTVEGGSDDGRWVGDVNNRDNVTIGTIHRSAGYNLLYSGSLAFFRYYDRELSSAEISDVCDQGRRVVSVQVSP